MRGKEEVDQWIRMKTRQKVLLQKLQPKNEVFGARDQLILIKLVPSGSFRALLRLCHLKFAMVRERNDLPISYSCSFPRRGSPNAAHRGEHRSYKNGGSGEERWVGKIKLERPGRQEGRPRRQAEAEMEKWNITA